MSRTSLVKILSVASITLAVLLIVTLASAGYLFYLSSKLPDLKSAPNELQVAETSIVYAADGSTLAEWYDEQDRTVIPADSIPKQMKQAVVAIEDKRFYEHGGIDMQAIARALSVNSRAGGIRQGGSTITQQTVKLLFTKGERTLKRKIEEALLALQLETRADKDAVLGVYLNTVYFGRGAYGVQSAAKRFFGVNASNLSLPQCALIAGCIQSPTRYDPFVNPAAALERRNVVLREMRDAGYISAKEFVQTSALPLELKGPAPAKAQFAPYFLEYVRQDLIARLGSERVYRGGLRIHTTLDPDAQRAAEAAAKAILGSSADPEVAIASVRWSDGAVVAVVGGRDFNKEHFDLATQGKRQTGSAFKPFVLAAALEEGYNLDSKFEATPFSTPVRDGIWHVENYENRAAARYMTLRAATVYSVNTVYARVIMRVGPDKVVNVAHRMGILTPIAPEPAIALGGLDRGVSPLEMASAFGTIANQGVYVATGGVSKVTDADGKLVYQPRKETRAAISKTVAGTMASVLGEVLTQGTGVEANFGQGGAAKTGTSQSWRDAWIVGYSGPLSTAVWVGYPKAQVAMTSVHGIPVTGGSFPARIWKAYMSKASVRRPAVASTAQPSQEPTLPAGYRIFRICEQSKKAATSQCPDVIEIELPVDRVFDVCTLKH